MENITHVLNLLSNQLNQTLKVTQLSQVYGGDINSSFKLVSNNGVFFVKENKGSSFPEMFLKEANGLNLLRQTTIKVPEVIVQNENFLVLEWLEEERGFNELYWKVLGENIAELHKTTSSEFGFSEDNYIGTLPQVNTKKETWAAFFIENRLEAQVKLALDNKKASNSTVFKI